MDHHLDNVLKMCHNFHWLQTYLSCEKYCHELQLQHAELIITSAEAGITVRYKNVTKDKPSCKGRSATSQEHQKKPPFYCSN